MQALGNDWSVNSIRETKVGIRPSRKGSGTFDGAGDIFFEEKSLTRTLSQRSSS